MPSVLDDFDASPRQETASALGGAPAAAPRVALPPGGPASPVAPPTPAATPAAQPQLRAFGDSAATRRLLYDNVLKATQAFEPLTNQRHTLALTDVAYVGPEAYTLAEQKKAILANQTLGRRLQGTWRLTDNATGQEVSRRKSVLANVPFMTEMGTFINNGTEYSLAHQMRLRPGVYTRQKANGELESHINVAQGKGLSHRVFMDPDTGIFRLQMGQARIPLLPILKAMGAKDSDLRAAWGNDLTAANMAKADPQAVSKVYAKLVRGDQPADPLSRNQAITEALGKMEIDPEVTKRTLGAPHKNLNAAAYLDITRKLLAVNRGEQQPDDRDALAYQTLVGPEDLFAERLRHARNAARLLLWKASSRGNLDSVPARTFEPQLQAALMSSGLGQAGEEVNPLEILDQQTRVTRMGVGGLPSIDSIPEESRSVHSSQLGFVDVLRTPECYDRETEVMTWGGWKRWPDVVQEDELACLVDGKLEFHRPQALYCYEYAGTMCGADTGRIDYLVTPEHRLWVKPPHKNGKYKFEQASAMRTTRRVLSGGFGPYAGSCLVMFRLPRVDALRNPKQVATTSCGLKNVDGIAIDDWAELVGWVLGEGSVQYTKRKPGDGSTYNVRISQSKTVNADNCCRIRNLLNRLPFSWCEPPSERGFVIGNKQLASYFRQFGTSSLRWIPEELLRARSSARQKLFESLMLGEGRKNKRGERTCFCSSSSRLAHDFQRLAFSLGYSTTIVFEPDERPQSNTGGGYVVHVHKHEEHNVSPRRCPSWGGGSDLYTEEYSGYVYCATVPGGLLYVRRRAGVGHWSGNSEKGGVELRLARAARKGPDGRIYTPVLDPKTGETVHKSPQDLADAVLAFPGEMNKQGSRVAAISGGNVRMVTRDKVNYVLPHMEDTFSPLGNMIPLKSAVKGQRAVMASRMLTQALPLVDAEAPLVQSGMPGQQDRSYEEEYAVHAGVLRSNKGGTVLGVSGDQIQLRGDDGQVETMPLNNHRVFNRKTFLHQTPVVKPGDKIQPGQLLAQSNYTDQNGVTAIGKNLRVGYVADRGHNFEDAISISASAAKRLTSEHAYQHGYEYDPKTKRGKKAFSSIFPAVYDKQTLAKFDDAGVIKPGTEVRYGEPLILAVQEKERTKNALHRGHGPSFQNATVTWDHRNPGVVTDVDTSDKGVNVVVKSMAAMEAGDKLAGRYGDKGVISRIIPDDQMPVAADGKPLEVLVNPLGLISRVNPAQIIEAALGKIAATTGRPYKLQDFGDTEDWTEYALKELQKHGMSDTEAVTDPETGRKIPGTLVGNRWFMKLHHSAESGEQGRGIGGYSSDETPSRGGYSGAKRIGMLELGALLSSGASHVIRDASLVRGQSSPQYWSQYMSGFKPPTPKVPFVYNKFVSQLKASGINVVRQGSQSHIMAMTDKDIDQLAGDRELQNADTVDWRAGLAPRRGGLFDEKIFGGHGGNRWGKLSLHEPMLNPVMEEPARRVLGLTENKFLDVLAGKEKLAGLSGPKAIRSALDKINLDGEIERARLEIKSNKKTARDAAVRRLGYLKSAQQLGIHPRDWVWTKVPVLPPSFRPVSVMGGGKKLPLVDDANYSYKELFDSNKLLGEMSHELGDDVGDERLAVYNALKGVVGLGDPIHPKNQERQVKGILQHVFGSSPKFGVVNRKLLGSAVDLVGRAVITPDPDLDMDHVGIPEDSAWDIYRPIVVRHLVRRGVPRLQAARAVEARSADARQALLSEMESRPVIINRAPTLHRYGMMAAWAKLPEQTDLQKTGMTAAYGQLTQNKTLRLSPLVVKGFGADFDGDKMNFHVPATDEAAKEAAEKMLPSKNLFNAATFTTPIHQPSQEYTGGLYAASARTDKKNRPLVFATAADAIRAYRRGEIGVDRQVEIMRK